MCPIFYAYSTEYIQGCCGRYGGFKLRGGGAVLVLHDYYGPLGYVHGHICLWGIAVRILPHLAECFDFCCRGDCTGGDGGGDGGGGDGGGGGGGDGGGGC